MYLRGVLTKIKEPIIDNKRTPTKSLKLEYDVETGLTTLQ